MWRKTSQQLRKFSMSKTDTKNIYLHNSPSDLFLPVLFLPLNSYSSCHSRSASPNTPHSLIIPVLQDTWWNGCGLTALSCKDSVSDSHHCEASLDTWPDMSQCILPGHICIISSSLPGTSPMSCGHLWLSLAWEPTPTLHPRFICSLKSGASARE